MLRLSSVVLTTTELPCCSFLNHISRDAWLVCRAHRDDQSAFTFLIAKYFNYGASSIRTVFLEQFTWVLHRQLSTIALLRNETKDYSCVLEAQAVS